MRSRDLRTLGLLTRAWLLSIVRDRAAIFWFLALPLIFVTLFGLAFGRSDAGAYAVGVAVDEATPAEQALLRGLRETRPSVSPAAPPTPNWNSCGSAGVTPW
ncbi:MAG: hypothetical protein U0531_15575 [Dehalococcoidia bacterium]